MDPDPDNGPNPETLFRAVKRRKFLRRRPDEESSDEHHPPNEHVSTRSAPAEVQEEAKHPVHPSDIARLRRLHRIRKGGIEFSATSRQPVQSAKQVAIPTTTAEDLDFEKAHAMCDRFTAHTGQTVDVDKHMMAYIDTEMAKRSRRDNPTDTPEPDATSPNETSHVLPPSDFARREPASLGKLHEIDLGQEAKLHNIARTEAATRRLAGDEGQSPSADESPFSKPELSEKGQRSWRTRKRRTSEDIERDRLVEEVLRESKLDVYDEPDEEDLATAGDQAADDRVAEQFRKDFLDAIQSRRRVARTKNTKTAKTEAPRGPKLGGSRSARAAMREMQEKAGRK